MKKCSVGQQQINKYSNKNNNDNLIKKLRKLTLEKDKTLLAVYLKGAALKEKHNDDSE